MRKPCSALLLLCAGCVSLISPLRAQTTLTLPGCDPSPEVRKVLDTQLDYKVLDKMKFVERTAYERRVLEDLIAKYPREIVPYWRLIQETRYSDPGAFPVLQDRFAKLASDQPDDPLALTLGGMVLVGKDTPEGIHLLESARTKAPDFPWAPLALADIYFSGKRADNAKAAENISAFFATCPASTNRSAQWILNKDAPLQPKVAAALRAKLGKKTDPEHLRDYETLWGLEFRTRPPSEHDALRKQIALDLKRLESLNPKGDAEWQAFLIRGYKQTGATQETITAMEDRLLKELPKSHEASELAQERWRKAHKEPQNQGDTAAWEKYDADYVAAVKGWIQEFLEDAYLQRYGWFYAIYNDDKLSENDGIAALDHFLKETGDYDAPEYWSFINVASFLTQHGWQPTRAIDLLNQAQSLANKQAERDRKNDNLSDEELKQQKESELYQKQTIAGILLKAAKQAGKPEAAQSVLAFVEEPLPDDKKFQSSYWNNRARLAALDNHKQDALAYYQLALQTRSEPAKPWHGKLHNDEMDEAHALWKELGGTEGAWAVWSNPPAAKSAGLAEGRWERPTKEIPVFELSDLSGKTWRLKELSDKTVLINLWATWCGPCNEELPQLQKFYEKVKDRPDIQVLTFNLDEDLGLVAPYLKEKGYTFPVLPAYSIVVSLLNGYAIPQNWIIDPKGTWRWTQIGYGGGTDGDFSKDMLERLESIKSSR